MKNIFFTLLLSANLSFAIVDINHTTIDELMHLKGICKYKAKSILTYIDFNGCFDDIDELTFVDGIDKTLLAINKKEILLIPCR